MLTPHLILFYKDFSLKWKILLENGFCGHLGWFHKHIQGGRHHTRNVGSSGIHSEFFNSDFYTVCTFLNAVLYITSGC